jgi:hypothetical protein
MNEMVRNTHPRVLILVDPSHIWAMPQRRSG